MNVQRCPECGQRLNSNYCDICMRKVPFGGVVLNRRKDPWDSHDGSSAHRMERGHECISFDYEEKPKKIRPPKTRKPAKEKQKLSAVIAIVMAVLTLLPALFEMVDDAIDSVSPEPDIDHSAFVEVEALQFEPTELYRGDGITVTVDAVGEFYDEFALRVCVDNESDRSVTVGTENICVNGFMLSGGGMYATAPEQTLGHVDYVVFNGYELEQLQIEQVAQIQMRLNIFDSDDYSEIARTEPFLLELETADTYTQTVNDEGQLLFEENGIRILLQGVEYDSFGHLTADLYVENNSEYDLYFYEDCVYLGGQESDASVWSFLYPGTRAVAELWSYDLEKLDIHGLEDIGSVQLDFRLKMQEGDDTVSSEKYTVTFDLE